MLKRRGAVALAVLGNAPRGCAAWRTASRVMRKRMILEARRTASVSRSSEEMPHATASIGPSAAAPSSARSGSQSCRAAPTPLFRAARSTLACALRARARPCVPCTAPARTFSRVRRSSSASIGRR
jgi:hypothetical protein